MMRLRQLILLNFIFFLTTIQAQEVNHAQSLVKIITTANSYNYKTPWQSPSQFEKFGTGFIIGNQKILTNAHVVSDSVFIEIRRADNSTPYKARVLSVDHDCDLAVLSVEEKDFFKNSVALEFGVPPKVTDKIFALGFPLGGDEMSITEGIISRTEVQEYIHSKQNLLLTQIDAPINPGNSGAPVLHNGKVVGVVSQGIPHAQNIGYMIPMQIVQHFLLEANSPPYKGFPGLGINIEALESINLREKYGMKEDQTGILITELTPEITEDKTDLKVNDILLSINNIPIANNGTILIDERSRVRADYLIHKHFIGDSISAKVLRDKKIIEIKVPLKRRLSQMQLVPERIYDEKPTYYIYSGFVFQPLTANYLYTYGNDLYEDNWFQAPISLTYLYRYGQKLNPSSQVVILNRVLPDASNVGYQYIKDLIIHKVNDKLVNSIEDVINAIKNNTEKYHIFLTKSNEQIILDKINSEQRHPEILKKYNINGDRSENL